LMKPGPGVRCTEVGTGTDATGGAGEVEAAGGGSAAAAG
jgi:hypothetical protein